MKSDKTRTELTKGLKASTKYDVAEAAYADYTPAAYVQQTNAPAMKKAGTAKTGTKGAGLSVTNAEVGNDGGYVYIENTFDDSSVTPTGIIINNLPYVLMVGIPVAGFAVMFANKRRHADEIA
jgi:NADH:ubiquinone oxidoreductase subunit F (NADH-binding)